MTKGPGAIAPARKPYSAPRSKSADVRGLDISDVDHAEARQIVSLQQPAPLPSLAIERSPLPARRSAAKMTDDLAILLLCCALLVFLAWVVRESYR